MTRAWGQILCGALKPLPFPLIIFADVNLLTNATRNRDPANAALPTATAQAFAILQFTTTSWTPSNSWCTPANRSGQPTSGPPPPTSGKANPYTWRTPQSTWESHRPHRITTSHSQTSWKGASLNYHNLAGGNSCLRRAWHTSWKRCSTQPSDTRPCTSCTRKMPYATLDSK